MGSAKTTLGEAWLGTRLREMHIIRLKRQSYTLTNRAITQTGTGGCDGPFYRASTSFHGREFELLVSVARRLGDSLLIESGG